MKVKNLIVGAGLAGLTLAERLANVKKQRVLVIDRRNHIGGNVYDYDDGGILVHKYGAHIFFIPMIKKCGIISINLADSIPICTR